MATTPKNSPTSAAVDEDRRRAPRQDISSTVEFVIDDAGTILEARGIDLSETGIGFFVEEAIEVALTVTVDGTELTRRARLVRVSADDGGFQIGLEFIEP